jgi:hypothetical protein
LEGQRRQALWSRQGLPVHPASEEAVLSTESVTPSPPSLSAASSCTPDAAVEAAALIEKDEQKETKLKTETRPGGSLASAATRRLEAVDDDDLAAALASLLGRLCVKNEQSGQCRRLEELELDEHIFFSKQKQPFSLESYVVRIIDHVTSRQVLITALVLIDRLFTCNANLALSEMNVHRILITAVLLASKFLEDEPYAQEFYRQAGGVPSLIELNKLEAAFLDQLDWKLFVTRPVYFDYYNAVCTRVDALFHR